MRTIARTNAPPLAEPGVFLRAAWLDLRRAWPLAAALATRHVRGQYRQSLLGAAVVVLPSLAMTAVALGFRGAGILSVDSATIPYGLFVLTGVILWTTFVDALNAPIHGLLSEQRMLSRTNAPPEAIVLGALGPVLFNAGVKMGLLAAAMAWYAVAIPPTVVLAPLGLLGLIALGTAGGLLLAPINLLYRDVSKVLVTITTFWFFVSPVYFPAPSGGALGSIMRLNPVTPLLSDTRALALTGVINDPVRIVAVILGTGVFLVLCWLCFRIALPAAMEQGND